MKRPVLQQSVKVALGQAALPVGVLTFNKDGTRESSTFAYHEAWLTEHGQWRLAPAFDINPFPDKDPELKLWLNEDYGPVDSIEAVVSAAGYFRLGADEAKRVLGEVYNAARDWKRVAKSAPVGMTDDDLGAFAPAFENEQMEVAATLL
jgi:serine/threonine-protein kinase HipA